MSVNLTNSALLYRSAEFRDLVRAAITEQAAAAIVDNSGDFTAQQTRKAVARAVVADPARLVDIFAALCADDAAISAATSAAAVDQADLRRVVSTRWNPVGSSVPNVGA